MHVDQKENMATHTLAKLAADTFIDRIWVDNILSCTVILLRGNYKSPHFDFFWNEIS
jgi:hypothetical protein